VTITIDPEERRALAQRVKVELRDRMKRVRRALGPEARAARSAKIAERVIGLGVWSRAGTVAVFVPMKTEVDVSLLERAAREDGKRIVAPRMVPPFEGAPIHEWSLELRVLEDGVDPIESGHMVREPSTTAPLVAFADVDLILVPALAFGEDGARLGYGAGHYDGLLPKCANAARVGVAFDFQLIAEVPEEPRDARVHTIVTDARVIDVAH
jgi:5-formyltetrahydrofolate cyclo-ligase